MVNKISVIALLLTAGICGCGMSNYNYRIVGYAVDPMKSLHYPMDERELMNFQSSSKEFAYVGEHDALAICESIYEYIDESNPVDAPQSHVLTVVILKRSNRCADTLAFDLGYDVLYYNSVAYPGSCALFDKIIRLFPDSISRYYRMIDLLPCPDA